MHRPVCALLLAVSVGGIAVACGTVKSEYSSTGRPLDLEYLTAAIFAPSCGQTQCHSNFHQAGGLVFDSPDDVRASLLTPASGPLLQFHSEQYDPLRLDGKVPHLIRWVTETFPLGEAGNSRMPFDAPLPDRDIELLEVWIGSPNDAFGNPTGLPGASAAGAQCDPSLYEGLACNRDDLVVCNDDFSFGEPVDSCPRGCEISEGKVAQCTQ